MILLAIHVLVDDLEMYTCTYNSFSIVNGVCNGGLSFPYFLNISMI